MRLVNEDRLQQRRRGAEECRRHSLRANDERHAMSLGRRKMEHPAPGGFFLELDGWAGSRGVFVLKGELVMGPPSGASTVPAISTIVGTPTSSGRMR